MNNATAGTRIEVALNNAWKIAYPNNELGLENKHSIDVEQERGKMFMLSDIAFDESSQSALVGSNSPYRVSGSVQFHIFTPAGEGTKQATEVSDFLIATFGLKTITGILFKAVHELSRSNPETVDLYRKTCIVNFTFDSITP
jgi:hypothetical protein